MGRGTCWLAVLGVLWLLHAPAPAGQVEISSSGYVAQLLVYETLPRSFSRITGFPGSLWLDLTRFRWRPRVQLNPELWLQLEYEADLLYFNRSGLFLPLPRKTNRQLVQGIWSPWQKAHLRLSHFVDRLYLHWEWRDFAFSLGRQRISWGTGRVWNPTDLFNPLNPAAFDRIERDGADVLSAKWYLGLFSSLEAVVQPQQKLADTHGGVRLTGHWQVYDLALLAGYFDRRWVLGGDFAGNFLTAGIRGEWLLSVNPDRPRDNFARWILGLDHQLNPELYAMLEVHFNGEGRRAPEQYQLDRLLRGEILNLNRWYLAGQTRYQIHPLIYISLFWVNNLVDGSGFYMPSLLISALSSLDLTLAIQASYGDPLEEYWYYPTAYFLRGVWYF